MKVGILGAGYISREHMAALQAIGGQEIFVCDHDQERAAEFARTYSCTAAESNARLLQEIRPDYVLICVPTPFHAELACEALRSRIPVLCEKPMASTLQEALAMQAAAQESGTKLMIAHCMRFDRSVAVLKRILSDGRFGALQSMRLFRHSVLPGWSAGNWLQKASHSGGAITDMHIHDSDLVQYFFGLPEAVTSAGNEMHCTTLYHFPGKADISGEVSWKNAPDYPFSSGIEATFERAYVELGGGGVRVYGETGVTADLFAAEPLPDWLSSNNCYENENRYFMEYIRSESPAEEICPVTESIESLKMVFAELKSAQTGKTVLL